MKSRSARVVVGALTVLALALRLPSIATRSLWLDEAWLANLAVEGSNVGPGQPGASVLAPVPPLFLLALRAVAGIVGRSAGGLRVLPLAASVAAVPLVYAVARRGLGRGTALIAAAVFACYPAAVTYGQELKPYSTDVLVVLGLLLIGELVAHRPERLAGWGAAALVEAITPGLSFPATLVLPGLALTLLGACRRGRERVAWAVSQGVAALAALGWWSAVIAPQHARPAVVDYWKSGFPPPGVTAAVRWFGAQLDALIAFALDRPTWAFATTVACGILLLPRRLRVQTVLVTAGVFAAAALRLYPFTPGRTTLFLLPFLYLPLAAAGLRLGTWSVDLAATSRLGRSARVAGVAFALLILVYPARGSLHPQAGLNWEETAPLIRRVFAERQPSDKVYVYYGAAPAFRFYHPEPDPRVVIGGSHRDRRDGYENELRPMLVPGERLWILFGHVFEGEGQSILRDMTLYGQQVDSSVLDGASLHLFTVQRGAESVRHLRLGDPSPPR